MVMLELFSEMYIKFKYWGSVLYLGWYSLAVLFQLKVQTKIIYIVTVE